MKQYLISTLICLWFTLFGPNFAPNVQAEETSSWKVISWASPVGPQALTYETLKGFKAMLSFINSKGGVNGLPIDLYTLEADDSQADFFSRLDNIVTRLQPDLAVGGAANVLPLETAEYFRRTRTVWFGPWSHREKLYQNRDNDPIGLLPTESSELELLFGLVGKRFGENANVSFIYFNAFYDSADLANVRQLAAKHKLNLFPESLGTDFRNWASLESNLKDVSAVVLWLPPGPAAAIVRTLKHRASKSILWMTSSLNFPGAKLSQMTGGRWNGMIFPSVLTADQSMREMYKFVLTKYGPPGLATDYQSFLGMAQGQLLVRALLDSEKNDARTNALRDNFKNQDVQGTLFYSTVLSAGPPNLNSLFLAEATSDYLWKPIE
ncbi:MAG: ABC transporter substrate-binding protein [Deltaproteobacteria bacterium]|nr:ABC transporter substrate-binding protein [Deltaproteobacteria bacterium]